MNSEYHAVIMAGGVGSRFWPMSKEALPKQFLDMLGTGKTLIQKTFDRIQKIVPPENIYILTNTQYESLIKEQLPQVSRHHIILEPVMRNTAPCILLASLKIKANNPNSVMIVAPSDHWIEDEEAFAKDIRIAFETCKKEAGLLTLGIKPTFPNTGYGYIAYETSEHSVVKKVRNFTEKPDYERAKSFLKSGNYLWNAGIFIAQTKTLTQAYTDFLPELYDLFKQGEALYNTPAEKEFIKKQYPLAENTSIDYGIMEKARNVWVLPASFDWNDLGSWSSLYDKMRKDEAENVIINADAHLSNSHRNLVQTPKGRTVVIRDLDNYIVVENENILMIYPMEKEQEIKQTRDDVQNKFGNKLG